MRNGPVTTLNAQSGPDATINLKNSDSIEMLAEGIELDVDTSVTCIGKDARRGFKVADKLIRMGVTNCLYLEGRKMPHAKELPLRPVKITNFKLTGSLEREIEDYNLCMWMESVRKSRAAAKACD